MPGLNPLVIRKRTTLLLLGIFGLIGILTGRLFYIQGIKASYYQHLAEDQRLRDIRVEPMRGTIFDRKLNTLAFSFETEAVYAIPHQIKDPQGTAKIVAEKLNLPEKEVYSKLTKKTSFVWLKMKPLPEEVQKIKEARLPGVEVAQKAQRFYLQGSLAAHVLGISGIDNQGLEGIEKYYDQYLSGIPGREQAEYDSKGDHIPLGERRFIDAQNGASLVLTIDQVIQYIAERELEKAVLENGAKKGAVILMDPMTGEILALANYPSFDPNHYAQYPAANRRNWVLVDQFEPGSTFKIVTAAAALEEGLVRRDSRFFDPGYIVVEDRRLKCWRAGGHGSQTFVEAVENSCNPVFAALALRLGQQKFLQYIHAFGFGQQTGVDFPGEARGIIPPPARIKNVELATIGFGQGISITPLQLLCALSAIANGGELLEPRLVKEIRTPDGKEVITKFEKKTIRRVISEQTARELASILTSVVENGSGNRARIAGYRVAGKTGTAQKPSKGGYGQERIASFIGFAPVENPKVAGMIILDEPQGPVKYGGVIAAPFFSSIVGDVLKYLEVEPSREQEERRQTNEDNLVAVPNLLHLPKGEAIQILKQAGLTYRELGVGEYVIAQNPKAGVAVEPKTTILLYCDEESRYRREHATVLVPNLAGFTPQEATKALTELGLKIVVNGSGIAYQQTPAPGTRLSTGATVTVYFITPDTDRKR
ncbi:MAG: PASTA domain-containing protein [Firmicutes bacterium]|nr:PASTA domain-containing protein [Bacillota bacterium]